MIIGNDVMGCRESVVWEEYWYWRRHWYYKFFNREFCWGDGGVSLLLDLSVGPFLCRRCSSLMPANFFSHRLNLAHGWAILDSLGICFSPSFPRDNANLSKVVIWSVSSLGIVINDLRDMAPVYLLERHGWLKRGTHVWVETTVSWHIRRPFFPSPWTLMPCLVLRKCKKKKLHVYFKFI